MSSTSDSAPRRPLPSTVAAHLSGSAQSWHGKITPDGPFPPQKGRYHLYIGLFCPFAHRVNLVRHLKGLTELIDVSVVKPYPKGDETGWPGWQFPKTNDEYAGATVDRLFGSKCMHEVYFKADPEYKGRYSVPVLWDRETGTIVNNESAELLRDLQTAFNPLLPAEDARVTLYPEHLRQQIDEVSEWMQRELNTGVYKAGFAHSQEAYDKNVLPVFAALNKLEKMVAENGGPYILGDCLTELDIRAYATLIRFDTVYVQHFKCNLGTVRHDYPQLNNYLKHLYWNVEGFQETTDLKHIKENYTKSHHDINPQAITPRGPYPDVEEGYEPDLSRVPVGGVAMPEVLELEKQLHH
ncbi:glutathione S-transferase [Capronia epimyces CBS 606.96]|uniref:Glutathione S-transferase n=1 Tax=Capronia epimyces CBS 606.96 TaxID=1182542 RepID=W9XQ32_9EURO|nr:glutathione S-transferase [Capronia epimyces CBS 606.96]EXJ79091.1 glutathione S-transferase [Capronia epimyces CBS 606.96]